MFIANFSSITWEANQFVWFIELVRSLFFSTKLTEDS